MKIVRKSSSDGEPIELILTSEAEEALARTVEMATELKAIHGVTVTFQITIEVDQSLLCADGSEKENQ